MLKEQLKNDLKEAMKNKEQQKLSTLRLLQSSLKNKEIDLGKELSEEEVLEIVKKEAKVLKDSATQFKEGGRDDLASGVEAELVFLEAYLPAQISDEDLETAVKSAIEESGATSKTDVGKVMGLAMKKVEGGADGGRVKDVVARLLS